MSVSPLQTQHRNNPSYGVAFESRRSSRKHQARDNEQAPYRPVTPTSIRRTTRTKAVAHETAHPHSPISIKSNFPVPHSPKRFSEDTVEGDLSFTISMGDRSASVIISGPAVPRVPCCGQTFPSDVSLLSSDRGSVKSLVTSLNRPTSEDGFAQKLSHMASRGQGSRIVMDLARIQLKIALAIYMDRADDFETENTLIHQTLHEISAPSVSDVWFDSNRKVEKLAMRRLPELATKAGANLALLLPYSEQLDGVRSPQDLVNLEMRIDQMFHRT